MNTKNKTVIEVVDRYNKELSSTKRCRHIRYLLKSGRAVIVSFAPFTVKLLYNVCSNNKNVKNNKKNPAPTQDFKQDFKLVRLKEKLGYARFIAEYPDSADTADSIVETVSTLEPSKQDGYDYVALKTIAANYSYQATLKTIFNVRKYIRACVVNYIPQNCVDKKLSKEVSEKHKREELDKRLEKTASRNKFANFQQREWDFDELKRITCDTED